MFALRHVSKSFGNVAAVREVDLDIAPGRTTALIGPSGCGKSTLLRLMNGLVLPDSGEVSFGGTLLGPESLLEARRSMGYVIQDGGLFPHLTAAANVALMARHLGRPRPQIASRIDELCSLTRFPADGLARYPAELSGGQRQRVGLMRALMLDPDALLLDEPLGALDPMIRYDLQNDLRDIFRGLRKTVVIVTHDLAEAEFLGDEIVLLRDGQIVQRGGMTELTGRPANDFVERFVRAQRPHGSGAFRP